MKKIIPQSIKNIYHLFRAVLANVWYGFPSRRLKVIGVTGTNGKTTTVQMIAKILEEAGQKIAVASTQIGVDPVGSCVGQKGVRVQAVINELGDEKIDVIAHKEDPAEFIKSALSPAKDLTVKINEKDKIADVIVPDDQLSLAIGKDGQNVRLAAKLTGYKIDIRGKSGTPKEVEAKEKAAQDEAKKALGVDKKGTEESKEPKETEEADKPDQPKEKGTSKKKEDKTQKENLSHPQADQTQPSEPASQDESIKNADGDKAI